MRIPLVVVAVAVPLALAGCVPTPAEPSASPSVAETVAAPRAWGETPAEQFAVGTWQCALSLDGAALPYGVSLSMSEDGLYSIEIDGSGAFQNFSTTVADGQVSVVGEPGDIDAAVGLTATVDGFPAEVPGDGESVTIVATPGGEGAPEFTVTASVEGDTVILENPTFGADRAECVRG